jgi:hypothetical protein
VYFSATIAEADLIESDDDLVYIDYINCSLENSQRTNSVAGTFPTAICAYVAEGSQPLMYILIGGFPTTDIESTLTQTSNCCGLTTTTTTTSIPI